MVRRDSNTGNINRTINPHMVAELRQASTVVSPLTAHLDISMINIASINIISTAVHQATANISQARSIQHINPVKQAAMDSNTAVPEALMAARPTEAHPMEVHRMEECSMAPLSTDNHLLMVDHLTSS